MPEHEITAEDAGKDLAVCAAYVIEGITNSEAKSHATEMLVDHFLSIDDVDSAAAAADGLEDPFFRDRLLIRVVSKCIDLNDEEYAFQLADAVEDHGLKGSAFETAALRLAAGGKFERALETAATLEHSSDTVAGIAVLQATASGKAEAWKTVDSIGYFKSKVAARSEIAAIDIENKDITDAAEWLEKAGGEVDEIEFVEDQIRALNELGNLFHEAGDAEKSTLHLLKAVEIANVLDNKHRDGFLVTSAIGLLKTGEVEHADETLDKVEDKTQLASCLYGFSRVFESNGETEDAVEAVEEANSMIKSMTEYEIRNTSEVNGLRGAVAVQFQRVGLTQRAVELAHENIDDEQRNQALTAIAQYLVMDAKPAEANEVAKGIEPESERVAANIGLSDAANTVENKELAVEYLKGAANLLNEIEQKIARVNNAEQIALRLYAFDENDVAIELAKGSLKLLGDIKDKSGQSIGLLRLAAVYKKLGIEPDAEDIEVLKTIARTSDW